MAVDSKLVIHLFLALTALKMCFFFGYRSTDFEVHRNWLALTYELPLKKWYVDTTNEWTLDYPPLFAYFECLLSRIAVHVDPMIVNLSAIYYSSRGCVIFQRMTVVISDIVWAYSLGVWSDSKTQFIVSYVSASMLMIDNIHFFYGSMLYGVLLLALIFIKKSQYQLSALVFAFLLSSKHIFLYSVPAFAVFYLKKLLVRKSGLTVGPFLATAV